MEKIIYEAFNQYDGSKPEIFVLNFWIDFSFLFNTGSHCLLVMFTETNYFPLNFLFDEQKFIHPYFDVFHAVIVEITKTTILAAKITLAITITFSLIYLYNFMVDFVIIVLFL